MLVVSVVRIWSMCKVRTGLIIKNGLTVAYFVKLRNKKQVLSPKSMKSMLEQPYTL